MQISTRSSLILLGSISIVLAINTWPTQYTLPGIGIDLTTRHFGWPLEAITQRLWVDSDTGLLTKEPEFQIRYGKVLINTVLGLALSFGVMILIERLFRKR